MRLRKRGAKSGAVPIRRFGRRFASYALIFSMILPTGISYCGVPVEAKVVDPDYNKTMLWSTSFESADNFRSSTLDEERGRSNVSWSGDYQWRGSLTGLVDSFSGSEAENDKEVMGNLFDNDDETKYLTKVNSPEIIIKLKNNEQKEIKSYYLTSANDASERDPKNWTLYGRNSDSESWVQIDSQSEQAFAERYQQKKYNIGNNAAYSQYRLQVTANQGNVELTQLAEFMVSTEPYNEGEAVPGMMSEITGGPSSTWNQKKMWDGPENNLWCVREHMREPDMHMQIM